MRKEGRVHKSIICTLFMVYGAIFDVDVRFSRPIIYFDYQLFSTSFLLKRSDRIT